MTNLWQDVAYGFRTMWKKPGFTIVAALSLALGIGANTVVFSLINGLLLRPLDFPDANRLVWVWSVPLKIVGVVGDIRLSRTQRQAQPIMYVPHRQQTPRWLGPGWAERSAMYFILRTSGNPKGMIPAMRNALSEVEPDKAPGNIRTVVEYLDRQVQYDRMYMLLLGIFGGIATVLAAIGIYGVMAYAVAERTREIGIRMALGASSGNVLKLVVRRAFILVGIGLVLGLGGAFALTRVISSALWEVKATDPLTYASVSFLLVLVALCACLIPTQRAVSVDPTVALRHE
jgi:putative ABC transport system permease protein